MQCLILYQIIILIFLEVSLYLWTVIISVQLCDLLLWTCIVLYYILHCRKWICRGVQGHAPPGKFVTSNDWKCIRNFASVMFLWAFRGLEWVPFVKKINDPLTTTPNGLRGAKTPSHPSLNVVSLHGFHFYESRTGRRNKDVLAIIVSWYLIMQRRRLLHWICCLSAWS